MKKYLYAFAAAATILFAGCSDDDSGNTASFESHIMIDNELFKPSPNRESDPTVVTYFSEDIYDDGEFNRRGFHLLKKASGNQPEQHLIVNIQIPMGRPDADGSYIFHLAEAGQDIASGQYTDGDSVYSLAGGTVIVDEMGDGKFSLTFEDIEAVQVINGGGIIPISGHFEGRFFEDEVN